MASKVILSENNNKHTSRLIKSFKAIDGLQDFSEKPEGVWGSTATIKCNNVTLKSSELDFEFDVPFDDNLEANEGQVIVYNLSDSTILQFQTNKKISIEAGYEGDTGVIFEGYVTKTFTKYEGVDKVTTIKIKDDIGEKESVELTKTAKVTAEAILTELLEKTGLPIANFKIERDYTYDNDVSIDEPLESAIKKYSEVCGVSTFTSKGKLYSCSLKNVSNGVAFNVSEETGMIGSPSPFEEQDIIEDYEDTVKGFDIEMLLQHRAAAGAVVNLTSKQYKGKYYIKSGKHRFNTTECITSIRVVEL